MQSYFDSKTYKQSKMTNPASASQRFKNHLAYQLGLCMLYFYQDGKSAPQDSSNAHTQALVAKNMGGGGRN